MFGTGSDIRSANKNGFTAVEIEGKNLNGANLAHRPSAKAVAVLCILGALIAASGTLPVLAVTGNHAARRAVTAANSAANASAEMTMMVTEAGQRLSDLGYLGYLAGQPPVTSAAKMDERMRWALIAFQRVEGRKPTGVLNAEEIEALQTATAPTPRETGYRHVEVDLTRQVLFVVEQNNTISLVLPISSGSGKLYTFQGKTDRAITPRGRFTVYNKIKGWRKAPLGMIYYPNYFKGGWAIHGSSSVPNHPASHGCVRIPIPTAKELSEALPLGTTVLVYDETDKTPGTGPVISQAR